MTKAERLRSTQAGMAKPKPQGKMWSEAKIKAEIKKSKANLRKAEAKGYHKEARDPADLGGWE